MAPFLIFGQKSFLDGLGAHTAATHASGQGSQRRIAATLKDPFAIAESARPTVAAVRQGLQLREKPCGGNRRLNLARSMTGFPGIARSARMPAGRQHRLGPLRLESQLLFFGMGL